MGAVPVRLPPHAVQKTADAFHAAASGSARMRVPAHTLGAAAEWRHEEIGLAAHEPLQYLDRKLD